MKISPRHALATVGLACLLCVPAMAATPAGAVSDIPAGIGQQPLAPGGSALPPGTQPANPGSDNDSKVRPETRMTPDSRQDLEKNPAVERLPVKPHPATSPGGEPGKDTVRESQ